MLKDLQSRDRVLVFVYVLVGLAALVGTQLALLEHLRDGRGGIDFLTDPFVNPASTFIAIDLLVMALVGALFMAVEGRRISLRLWWLYVVLVFAVAVSVAFPLFLAARHVTLARRDGAGPVVG